MSKLLILLMMVCLFAPNDVEGIWWWFSSDKVGEAEDEPSQTKSTEITQVFAPFEMSNGEEKFLRDAKNYLQNLPLLDQCNMLIINRLKSSCSQLSDEELSKLSVNLLNCQSAVEGRKTYQCSNEMALSECTGPMDPDTWNSYHIISNRARAICYNIRQTHFRMKTEQTVNQLASSTLNNINLLKQLASGQQHMQEIAEKAADNIAKTQEQLLTNQESLAEKQSMIGGLLQNNMEDILKEKKLIAEKHVQVEEYTKMINEQLVSLSNELKSQDENKKEKEKEILRDLDSVKSKADEVLQKLGNAFEDVDMYHDSIEEKQKKTLKNLEEIQEAIAFMSNLLEKISFAFNDQIPWLQDLFGGTVDKLTLLTNLLGHIMFFFACFFAVIFIEAPGITRALLLFLVPVNCLLTLHASEFRLEFLEMAWLLAASVPGFYLFKQMWFYWYKEGEIVPACHRSSSEEKEEFTFKTPEKLRVETVLKQTEAQKKVEDIFTPIAKESLPTKQTIPLANDDIIRSSSPIRNLNFRSVDSPRSSRKFTESVLNSSSPRLNTSLGMKCSAKTKSGSRCKNSTLNCSMKCHVHTPQKGSQ